MPTEASPSQFVCVCVSVSVSCVVSPFSNVVCFSVSSQCRACNNCMMTLCVAGSAEHHPEPTHLQSSPHRSIGMAHSSPVFGSESSAAAIDALLALLSVPPLPFPPFLMGPYGLTPPESSSSTPLGLAAPSANEEEPHAYESDDSLGQLRERQQAQALRLAACCRTRPLPGTPPPDDAASGGRGGDTWHGARTARSRRSPEYTIYTHTRLQVAERATRFERLRAFIEDGTGYDQFGVIVVPTTSPPARARGDLPIFTRTRAQTRRAAAHGSFPSCPSPKRQRRA